jgi:hypothetical protein
MEIRNRGLIKALFQQFPGGTEEKLEREQVVSEHSFGGTPRTTA